MPTNQKTTAMFDTSSQERTEASTPIEALEKAYDNHQADVRASKLADSAQYLFEQMDSGAFRQLGIRRKDPTVPEDRDDILAALAERNLYLVFQGEKPAGDDRNFVYGNSEKRLDAAILVLGAYPFRPGKEMDADFYICRPDSDRSMRTSWAIEEVEIGLFNAIQDLSGGEEEDGEE